MAGSSSPHPGRVDRGAVARYDRLVRPVLSALWPVALTGAHRLPTHDRYLLVANHSGLGVVESVGFAGAWIDAVGEERPVAPMAHSALFRRGPMRSLLRSIGAVEATREGAAHARAHGAALLLFPGGDRESMRPLWRAGEVDFGGRTGWIRLARELDLTLVPLAITGSHRTIPNLGRSRALAWLGPRLLGIRWVPLPALSLVGAAMTLRATRGASLPARAAAAAAVAGCLAFVPFIPSRVGYHVLEPLTADELAAPDTDVYARVTGAIAKALCDADRLSGR